MTSSPSYIDYETFLDPSFSPTSFAQTLVATTNNPSDTPLDLSTPLSRVLFDIQEVDSHVHTLTTKSALPLLRYTTDTTASGQRVLLALEAQVLALTEGYQRLEKDVVRRWEGAEEVRGAAERSWATVKLARAVSRCLMLGRQLEGQLVEISGREREDHRALVRASQTLLMLRRMFADNGNGDDDGEGEGYGVGLERVKVVRTLKAELVNPAENSVKARAQQIVSRFSLPIDEQGAVLRPGAGGTGSTYAQQEESRARLISAMTALYLLSPTTTQTISTANFQPELLLVTLKSFIHASLTASLQALLRGLSQLPSLERALLEVSNRCQTVVVLERILQGARQPAHPFYNHAANDLSSSSSTLPTSTSEKKEKNVKNNLLYPLLQYLDTSSLPSYFWRCLASALSPRVGELLNRGGAAARALRGNRERLRDEIRQCVLRGSSADASSRGRDREQEADGGGLVVGNWEREAAVMVGAVLGNR
ncbi:golgi transport complex component Cog5 [Nannizzia gypsea CBS 118893]|uniref:Conserved oligomeric Golgi complex subunit 5 n=1 Tax=Arthroderma gypseum (strain ATCC MYA-4604 / CBS 118893) TaxID=535722 RepID=E5R0Q3_ARTGP|nr:golgi transport complex component Cog5 [Nannizzia gypsea CBS 118893]EFQ97559.1 golgi transport complex component Cog5 [Nannizzia gypsea CBS 118893]